jgi:hypothetical protein
VHHSASGIGYERNNEAGAGGAFLDVAGSYAVGRLEVVYAAAVTDGGAVSVAHLGALSVPAVSAPPFGPRQVVPPGVMERSGSAQHEGTSGVETGSLRLEEEDVATPAADASAHAVGDRWLVELVRAGAAPELPQGAGD